VAGQGARRASHLRRAVLFSNGLAKVFSFSTIEIGPYSSSLVDREEARGILETEVAKTELPGLPTLVNDVFLANYGFFQWVLTAVELGVGAALIVGLATRGAALIGLGQMLFLPAPLPVQRGLDVGAAARMGAYAHPPPRPRRPRLGAGPPVRRPRHPAATRLPVLTPP
jgi:hypothetical protein